MNLFLKYGADVNAHPESVKYETCNNTIDSLLIRFADFNLVETNFPTVLQFFIMYDAEIAIQILNKLVSLELNALNVENESLFSVAVRHGRTKIVQKIIDLGVNYTEDCLGDIPLYSPMSQENWEMIRLLLDSGVPINCRDFEDNPLILAISWRRVEMLKFLLSRGADINIKNRQGRTPLHLACEFVTEYMEEYMQESLQIISILLNAAPIVDHRDKCGLTVLHDACEQKNLDVVQLLLTGKIGKLDYCYQKCALSYLRCVAKEDFNIIELQLSGDNTAEINSCRFSLETQIVHKHLLHLFMCLENDIHVNIRDKKNKTPLHYTAENCCSEIIKSLLMNQADVSFVDNNGFSALEKALKYYDLMCQYRISPESADLEAAKRIAEIIAINETNGHDVYEEDLMLVNNDLLRDYFAECKEEIRKMNEKKISEDSFVCFYDFLSKDIRELGKLARNKSIMLSLKSEEYKKELPVYSDLLERRVNVAEMRKMLLQVSELSFQHLIMTKEWPKLSSYILQFVFENLINEELLHFAIAATPKRHVKKITFYQYILPLDFDSKNKIMKMCFSIFFTVQILYASLTSLKLRTLPGPRFTFLSKLV